MSKFRGLFGQTPALPIPRNYRPAASEEVPSVSEAAEVVVRHGTVDWSGRGSDTRAVGWFGGERSERL